MSLASDLIGGDNNGAQDVFVFSPSIAPLADADGDGMADEWEMRNFGDLTHDGSADSDGDGLSDWIEYRTGTNPRDRTSGFSPRAAVSPGTGEVTITWQSAPGRSYTVQYRDDLNEPNWNNLANGVTVTGSNATCLDTRAGGGNQRFYRVTLVE